MLEWLQVFGRFHMVVLHLPIGLLAGLAAVEAFTLIRRRPPAREVTGPLAWFAALAAVLAASMGYVLSFEDGYAGDTLTKHLYLGLSLAGASVLAAMLHGRQGRAPFRAALGVALVLLVPTGHLGGVMTHGEDFLTAPLHPTPSSVPGPTPAPIAIPAGEPGASLPSFAATIAPIIHARCAACHGESRTRGGLALHTPEGIRAGGKRGPVINPGDLNASELLRRLRLPLQREGHMPPKDKPQPTPDELQAIESWIAAGAPFDASFSISAGPAAEPATRTLALPPPGPAPTSPAPAAALAALRARLAHLEPVERGSNLLWIDFAASASTMTDEDVESLLGPIRDHVAELSLARARISDRALRAVGSMPNLRRLDLRSTPVTDAGLAALRSHARLEELVLAQTKLTDAAVDSLATLPSLKLLNLWRSGVSPAAVVKLSSARGALVIEMGDRPVGTPLQSEDAIKLASDAAPAPASADALKPRNTACPVSGKPVDPDYVIVYRGRVIGFCCRLCAEQFWADPAKFEGALSK